MSSKDKPERLAEEFVATTLRMYLETEPQEAIKLAIQYYKYNSKLRHECLDLCELTETLNARVIHLIAIQEFILENNRLLQSALKKSMLQLLFLWFLLSFISTLLYFSVRY
ncbi:MAG: hypothetical protein KME09_00045 [Pleurocapsa minor HA4230-MV1]|jgi:hypothetical protein|nr:hypothetical protein [Pleurocapsa minor HA4230-MV1]